MPDQALVWIDPAGATIALRGGADTSVQDGATGRFSPPPLFISERVPLQPGQRFRSLVHGPLTVAVPVTFRDASAATLRTTLRNWARALDPTRGDGTLRVTDPSGGQRDLVCRCSGGLDQIVEDDWSDLFGNVSAVLHFTAEQPYWQDSSDTVQSWQLLSSLSTFFPLFPLRLSGSEVFADATVDNTAGDVEAWPVWVITGPGSSPILRNLSSGKMLSLPVALLSGESVTVDTRHGRKTVTKQDGSNLFGLLAGGSALWSMMARQSNSIRIELSGATPGVTQVQLNVRKRYLSA